MKHGAKIAEIIWTLTYFADPATPSRDTTKTKRAVTAPMRLQNQKKDVKNQYLQDIESNTLACWVQ